MYKVLTVAGSDSCSGAGVQADLQTIRALGAYGICAVTAVTAQNTLGVSSVFAVPASFVGRQIDSVVTDIGIDSLKTGMLVDEHVVEVVCNMVRKYRLENLVVDPVINSHGGERLLTREGVGRLCADMIPLSCLITPNIPEAEILTGRKIRSVSDMKDAAEIIYQLGAANVLIKGGHMADAGNDYDFEGRSTDVFYDGKAFECFAEKRIRTEKVHGTGCIYSAAIATELAKGNDLKTSITNARKFVTRIIKNPLTLGKGNKLASFSL